MRRSWAKTLTPLFVVAIAGFVFSWWTHGFRAFTNFSAARLAAGPIPRQAPSLPVVDEHRQAWDVAAPSGEYRLVQAMYLRCPDACPIAMSKLGQVADVLGDDLSARLKIVSISVDHDSPEDLFDMWEAHGSHPAWSMASLTTANMDRALADLGVWIYRRPDGLINHGLDTFLLDPSGKIIRIYSADERTEDIVADLRAIIGAAASREVSA